MKRFCLVLMLAILLSLSAFALDFSVEPKSVSKGDLLHISGTGEPNTNLTIQAWNNSRLVMKHALSPGQDGSFSYDYSITFLDPSGEWRFVTDQSDGQQLVRVSQTASSATQVITFSSPVPGSFQRTSRIPIAVTIAQGEQAVHNTRAAAWGPDGKRIDLVPKGGGIFEAEIRVPFDQPLGDWELLVTSEERSLGSDHWGGENRIMLSVEKAILSVQSADALPGRISQGERIPLVFTVLYPDGQPALDANVSVNVNNQMIVLQKKPDNRFAGEWIVPAVAGETRMIVSATDSGQNTGTTRYSFVVSSWLESTWQQNAPLVVLAAMAVIGLVGLVFQKLLQKSKLENSSREQAVLEAQLKKLQNAYFKEQSISRSEFESRSAAIQNELKTRQEQEQKKIQPR